jgi:hypothetical protein
MHVCFFRQARINKNAIADNPIHYQETASPEFIHDLEAYAREMGAGEIGYTYERDGRKHRLLQVVRIWKEERFRVRPKTRR